ncbi:MAG: DUF998 domain-containing protein, partial [Halobacteria archaeon]|nr:DUF998 domain-containing protein [Halobacteria archaeon]
MPAWSGIVAPLVAFGGIVLALITAPSFSFTGDALSNLGVMNAPTSTFFNMGLLGAGVVSLPFGFLLWFTTHNLLEKLGVASIIFSVFSMSQIGIFTLDSGALHLLVALNFYSF